MLRDVGAPSDRRYSLLHRIGSGGMAEVFIGRLQGKAGFSRTVAIKRLHRNLIDDETFVAMLLDEARLAGRIQHPNVASAIDVLEQDGEVLLIMEYVVGETLGKLTKRLGADGQRLPLSIVSAVGGDVLAGLHAAHTAVDESGKPLGIVHRDVSPQNLLVGADGTTRVLDFGIAKASSRLQTTREGQVKGKLGYMAPEQLRQQEVDARTDVFAMGVVLWETITGRRLFHGTDAGGVVTSILMGTIEKPSVYRDDVPAALDELVSRALERDPEQRFRSAWEMAAALERTVPPASARAVSDWVTSVAGDVITERRRLMVTVENEPTPPSTKATAATPSAVAPVTETEFSDVSRTEARRRSYWAPVLIGLAVVIFGGVMWFRHAATAQLPSAPPPSASYHASAVTPAPTPAASVAPSGSSARATTSAAPVVKRPFVVQKPRTKTKTDCRVERYSDPDGTPRFRKVCD